MKTIAWLIAGFAMLALSSLLESMGDTGASPAERLPLYLPALAALIGAPFCFYRGIRGAIAEIIGGDSDKSPSGKSPTSQPRAARRIAQDDTDEAAEAFDADAALARYMEKRAAQPTESIIEPSAQQPVRSARPSFGRRVG